MAKATKGPEFTRFFGPLLDALRELGGSASAAEATDWVIEREKITVAEQEQTNKNGQSRVRNQVAWARFYLVKAGLLDTSRRGVWGLTEKATKTTLSRTAAIKVFKEIQKAAAAAKKNAESTQPMDAGGTSDDTDATDHRAELLGVLKTLPPSGFERICQRLLRESGFTQVQVTGKSGDGGIDGHGVLEVNRFVTFKVLFQCKRYTDKPVSCGHVRDFRGAMMGRADKGIIITTGSFTIDAKKEARRDGVPPIEMVDGEMLVEMFESLELGLRPRKAYELDYAFFDTFRDK
ncbi:MAG: restriction endonuclease [Deltaproteobacteria bacterium]|nr:restriction endonuclease [Deltaproteobacteria bacterium]